MSTISLKPSTGGTVAPFEQIDGGSVPALSPPGAARIYYDKVNNTLKLSRDTGPYLDLLTGGGTIFTEITVFPSNTQAFPGYGVKTFGTDLNAAWASIPRADLSYLQSCNDWVVVIPANVYVPASNDLSIIGTTVAGSSRVLDFGYTGSGAVGRVIAGPGIPPGTTIASIGVIAGSFFGTVSYTAGSDVVTGIASTANLFVGQTVYSGSGALALPYCTIISILGPNSIQVSTSATQTIGTLSMTAVANVAATISAPATSSNAAANYSVNVPLVVYGTATLASNVLTAVSYVCNDMVGKVVAGPNLPPGTTVVGTTYSAVTNTGTLTLSSPATGSGAGAYELQIPSIFYCDTTRRRICNLNIGPTNLGVATAGSLQSANFWTPQPGADSFVDLHIQMSSSISVYGTRQSWRWDAFDEHSSAWTTHVAYAAKTRLTGTVIFLDPMTSSSPNQHGSFGDLEVFGNPGRSIQSMQSGSTNSTATLTVTNTLNLYPGQAVSGPNIPAGTLISSITNGTQLVMTAPATGSGPGSFLFDPGRIVQTIQAGTTVIGTTALTGLASTSGIYPGQPISGVGIPAACFVRAVTSLTAITMTLPATTSGTNPMTFAPQAISLDGSLLSATTTNFLSTYKSRWRGTVLGYNHFEIGMAENVEFSTIVFIQQYSHVATCAFRGGMVWTANSNNFDLIGFFGCQVYTSAAFIGIATAPLRMDAFTNYSFKAVGATLGPATAKQILNDPTSANASLTVQSATIPTTTIFTPSVDGTYQISVYASCTTAGAGNVTITLGWRDDAAAQTIALPALSLAALVGGYVQQTINVRCKAGQPITYAASAAGIVGAQFALYVSVVNSG